VTCPPADHPKKRWHPDEIQRARQRHLAPLLAAMGHRLHPLEDGNFRLIGDSGDLILKENYWIRTDTAESGNAIDFFVKIRGMSFIETMRLLLS